MIFVFNLIPIHSIYKSILEMKYFVWLIGYFKSVNICI